MIMECPKLVNLLYDTAHQPLKFRTRNWVEINDKTRGIIVSIETKFNFPKL